MSAQNEAIVQFLDETKKLLSNFMKYLEGIESRIKKIEAQITEP